MPVREKKFKCGKYFEVEIYPISVIEQKKNRATKKKESRKEQKNLNDKNARKNLRRRIHANFTSGKDYVLHLTYDKKHLPQDEEQAIRDRNNYLRRVKNFAKKNNLGEIKYISVLEYKEATEDKRTKTRAHHHMIITGIVDRDKLEDLWGKGTANADRLQENELGFQELANYLSKQPRGKKRWAQSRNIIIPEPDINDYKISKRKLIELFRNGCREEYEKMYPGYIFTDAKAIVNDITSGIYLYIKMRRQ